MEKSGNGKTGSGTTDSEPLQDPATPKKRIRRRAGKRVQRSRRREREKEGELVNTDLFNTQGHLKPPDDEPRCESPSGYAVNVSNIHPSASRKDLIGLFARFGILKTVEYCEYSAEATVTFVRRACALDALDKCNGIELRGQDLKISSDSLKPTPLPIGHEWKEKIRKKTGQTPLYTYSSKKPKDYLSNHVGLLDYLAESSNNNHQYVDALKTMIKNDQDAANFRLVLPRKNNYLKTSKNLL